MTEFSNPELFSLSTTSPIEFSDISSQVLRFVKNSGIREGLVLVYTPHTTAAITINENADPSVKHDMSAFLKKLVPAESWFRHMEGNSHSHILSSLLSPSQTFILQNGNLVLGTWQGIFFCEFDGPRSRKFYVKILPDPAADGFKTKK